MKPARTIFHGLTVADTVPRTRLILHPEMNLTRAAQLLLERQLGVAPVADAEGRCVGVLSTEDILRWKMKADQVGPGGALVPAEVWCDWQIVNAKSVDQDRVRCHMTRDPLLVTPDTRLAEVASMLLGPRCRPVVVVDATRRPLGVVSTRDVLAALVSARRPREEMRPAGSTSRRLPPRRFAQPAGAV